MSTITPKGPAQWRRWLEQHHAREREVWVVYVKAAHGRSMTWSDAVDEALCFGWIDSTARRLDAKRYMQRFTPRRRGSRWSAVNRAKAERLIAAGKMTRAGLAEIERARRAGLWPEATAPRRSAPMPTELRAALAGDARAFYLRLSPGYQNLYRRYVGEAKKPQTRRRRAERAAALLAAGQKNPLGIPQPPT